MLKLYWNIGKIIMEIQQGNERATYGDAILEKLSERLTKEFGKGFSKRNIERMRKFYICFPIATTVSSQLSWLHYLELIKIEEENTVNNAIEKANKIRRILLLGAFGVIMVMGIIWAIIKHKSAVEEDEKYEYDEEDKKKINFEEEEILSQVANKKKGKHF